MQKTLGFLVAALVLAIGFWWPWDGIHTKEEGEYATPGRDGTEGIPQGWQLAPFGAGFNIAVFAAFVAQLVPLESAQLYACQILTPPSSDQGMQLYMGIYLKGIESAAKALRRFPDSKAIQGTCTNQAAQSCLFNRATTVKAGQAGFPMLALDAFRRFKEDPYFQVLGNLGCFFDYSPENAQRFGRNGGIQYIHEVIKMHYGNTFAIEHAFFAYSSGCMHNPIICATEPGLIEDMVRVMKDHKKVRVREEVFQVIKGVSYAGRKYRMRLAEEGMIPEIVATLEEKIDSKSDQSVGCEAIGHMLSPEVTPDKEDATFLAEMQTMMANASVLEQVMKTVGLEGKVVHGQGHGGQNDAALAQYNIGRSCFQAITNLAWRHPSNQDVLVKLGAPATIALLVASHNTNDDGLVYFGCRALTSIGEGNTAAKLLVDEAISEQARRKCRMVNAAL